MINIAGCFVRLYTRPHKIGKIQIKIEDTEKHTKTANYSQFQSSYGLYEAFLCDGPVAVLVCRSVTVVVPWSFYKLSALSNKHYMTFHVASNKRR